MKFDWDCARTVMLALEALPDTISVLRSHEVSGYDHQKTVYHMQLLIEGGLICGQCSEGFGDELDCHATRLTWQGHQLLDSIRPQSAWNTVKSTAREKGLSLTIDVVKTLAKQVVDSMLR